MKKNLLSVHSYMMHPFICPYVHPFIRCVLLWNCCLLSAHPEALGSSLKASLTFSISKSDKTKAESHRPSLWDCDMLNDEPQDKNACHLNPTLPPNEDLHTGDFSPSALGISLSLFLHPQATLEKLWARDRASCLNPLDFFTPLNALAGRLHLHLTSALSEPSNLWLQHNHQRTAVWPLPTAKSATPPVTLKIAMRLFFTPTFV